MIQNRFEENQFFLDGLSSAILKDFSVASINCIKVRCVPFLLSRLKMKEDRRGIEVGLISVRPVEDSGGFCEEVVLNRVAWSTFTIFIFVEYEVSLYRLILDLGCYSPW